MYPNVANLSSHGGMQQGTTNSNQSTAPHAMLMQAQLNSLSAQQRQLMLLQHQQMLVQRPAHSTAPGMLGAGMSPGMMNAQALHQQRLAMQRQGVSPLNPNTAAGASAVGSDPSQQQQFAAALRSNPAVPGIARSVRSPSGSELGTPRLGGRIPSGGQGQSEEYHRALLHAQQQRNAQAQMQQAQAQQRGMMQSSQQGQGQSPAWQNMGQFGAGVGQNSGQGYGNGGGTSSPSPAAQGNWSQLQAGFPLTGSSSGGNFPTEHHPGSRQASSTPAPMSQHSPSQSNSELDIYSWTQG